MNGASLPVKYGHQRRRHKHFKDYEEDFSGQENRYDDEYEKYYDDKEHQELAETSSQTYDPSYGQFLKFLMMGQIKARMQTLLSFVSQKS